jgi:hypothetical protein
MNLELKDSLSNRKKKSRAAEAALLGLLGERDDKDTVR